MSIICFWIPFTKECFVQSLVEVSIGILEIFFKFSKCNFPFLLSSSFGKYLESIVSIPFNPGYFVLSLIEIYKVVPKKNIFKVFSVFMLVRYIISLKRVWPFIWINFNCVSPKMLFVDFIEIGPVQL